MGRKLDQRKDLYLALQWVQRKERWLESLKELPKVLWRESQWGWLKERCWESDWALRWVRQLERRMVPWWVQWTAQRMALHSELQLVQSRGSRREMRCWAQQ